MAYFWAIGFSPFIRTIFQIFDTTVQNISWTMLAEMCRAGQSIGFFYIRYTMQFQFGIRYPMIQQFFLTCRSTIQYSDSPIAQKKWSGGPQSDILIVFTQKICHQTYSQKNASADFSQLENHVKKRKKLNLCILVFISKHVSISAMALLLLVGEIRHL